MHEGHGELVLDAIQMDDVAKAHTHDVSPTSADTIPATPEVDGAYTK
jgi:hypothetical protein